MRPFGLLHLFHRRPIPRHPEPLREVLATLFDTVDAATVKPQPRHVHAPERRTQIEAGS